MKEMVYRCLQCGNREDFIQFAKVDCVAYVDKHGDFTWWKSENFENPDFDDEVFCAKCDDICAHPLEKIEVETMDSFKLEAVNE